MNTVWTLVGIAAFVGLLAYATMGSQHVECEVCVNVEGRVHCAKAAAETEEQAYSGALSTACGTAAGAMDLELGCRGSLPQSSQCTP